MYAPNIDYAKLDQQEAERQAEKDRFAEKAQTCCGEDLLIRIEPSQPTAIYRLLAWMFDHLLPPPDDHRRNRANGDLKAA